MNAKHTPCVVISVAPEPLDVVLDEGFSAEAAKLIALHKAAPELYEALRMICDSGVPLTETIESAMCAAISKAEKP
jgi:molybdopterin-guanine dinucleotide biosynthesis protein